MKSFGTYLPFNMVWAGIIPSRWFKAVSFIFSQYYPLWDNKERKIMIPDMWIHLIQPSSQHSPFSVILLTQQVVLKEKGEISLI